MILYIIAHEQLPNIQLSHSVMLSGLSTHTSLPTSFPDKANWGQAPLPRLHSAGLVLLHLKSPICIWLLGFLSRPIMWHISLFSCLLEQRHDTMLSKDFIRACSRMPQVTLWPSFCKHFQLTKACIAAKRACSSQPFCPASLPLSPLSCFLEAPLCWTGSVIHEKTNLLFFWIYSKLEFLSDSRDTSMQALMLYLPLYTVQPQRQVASSRAGLLWIPALARLW